MCGIFGWVWGTARPSPTTLVRRAVLITELARHMDKRGDQSWGVYCPETGLLHREVGSIQQTALVDYIRQPRALVHTRFATTGKIKEVNAHPFRVGAVVGAHNGIISNHDTLNRKYQRNFRVDSMHLLAHLDEGRELDDVLGYGAVEFVRDSDTAAVFIGRFNGGSLHVVNTPLGVVWASTVEALLQGCVKAGVELDACDEIDLADDALYRVDGTTVTLVDKAFFHAIRPGFGQWEDFDDRGRRGLRADRWERAASIPHKVEQAKREFSVALVNQYGWAYGELGSTGFWRSAFDPYDLTENFYKHAKCTEEVAVFAHEHFMDCMDWFARDENNALCEGHAAECELTDSEEIEMDLLWRRGDY